MAPLPFMALTTATTGSYRTGAVMMVAFVIGQLAVSIPVGRLLDRAGLRRGMHVLLWSSVLTALAGGPTWRLLVAAGLVWCHRGRSVRRVSHPALTHGRRQHAAARHQ